MRALLLWLSVPAVPFFSSRIFIAIQDFLHQSDPLYLKVGIAEKLAAEPAFAAAVTGSVFNLGIACAAAILASVAVAVVSLVLTLRHYKEAGQPLHEIYGYTLPALLSFGVVIWFQADWFYPALAEHLIDATVDARLSNEFEADIRFMVDGAVGFSLISWCVISSSFSALLVTGAASDAAEFQIAFNRTLRLAVVPLIGTSVVLALFYNLGGDFLTAASDVSEGYRQMAQVLVNYWAVMVSFSMGLTALYVFLVAGVQNPEVFKSLEKVTSFGVFEKGLTILSPAIPTVIGAIASS